MTQEEKTVSEQLRLLHSLQEGWMNGIGRKPPVAGLIWLEQNWLRQCKENIPTPSITATEAGGVQMEWTLGETEASLDVQIDKGKANFLACRVNDDGSIDDISMELNLNDINGWKTLNHTMHKLVQSQQ